MIVFSVCPEPEELNTGCEIEGNVLEDGEQTGEGCAACTCEEGRLLCGSEL